MDNNFSEIKHMLIEKTQVVEHAATIINNCEISYSERIKSGGIAIDSLTETIILFSNIDNASLCPVGLKEKQRILSEIRECIDHIIYVVGILKEEQKILAIEQLESILQQ